MKKFTLTLATIVIALLTTVNFSNASTKFTQTTLTNISNINKIEVHGNVEVYVSNGIKDEVTVNNDYYADNALVQEEDGVLRISSYKTEKLIVYVTANDLRAITAYDNASVKSDGRFSSIALDVNLHDAAYVGLNLDNHAKADLSGSITEYTLNYSQSSTVNRSQLVALNTTETVTMPYQAAPKHGRHHMMSQWMNS
jgi:hypothetical protein